MGRIDGKDIFAFEDIKNDAKKLVDELKKQFDKLKGAVNINDVVKISDETNNLLNQYNENIKKLSKSIDSLTAKINKGNTAKQRSNKTLSEEDRLKKRVERATKKLELSESELNRQLIRQQERTKAVTARIREQERAKLGLTKRTNGLFSSFKRLTQQLRNVAVAYFGFQTLIRGVKDIFNVTKTLDAMNFAIQKVIKSTIEQGQTQAWLSDIVNRYGLDLVAVTERYIKFRAATISSNLSAQQTQQIFESVSKASAVLGLKTDELRGVYLALEQMISKNKVTTEELRRQLGERLPGAFDIMAKSIGVTSSQLNEMLRNGEVMAEEVLPNFAKELEKTFGIENVRNVDTLVAAQNRLRTAWIELVDAIQAGGAFKGFFNTIASGVRWIKENINLVTTLGKVLTNLGATYLILIARRKVINSQIYKSIILRKSETTVTGFATAANKGLSLSLNGVAIAAKSAWAALGGWVGVIFSAISIILPFATRTKKATEQIKSFNQEVDEEHKKLNVLFYSLKNAEKGTKEWMYARTEINKQYSQYLKNIIDENTAIEDLNEEYEKLKKITRSNIAERRKSEESNIAHAKALEVENRVLDELHESQKQQIRDGEITSEEAATQRLRYIDLARSLADTKDTQTAFRLGMQDLVKAYMTLDNELIEISNRYDDLINKPSKEGIFRPEVFEAGLKKAKGTFYSMRGLSEETSKVFSETNKILLEGFKDTYSAKNFKSYESFLNHLLIKYKDNIRARILIEQELFAEINRGGRSTDDSLKIAKEENKRKLEEFKESREKQLMESMRYMHENGASELEIQRFYEDQIAQNKIDTYFKEIELNKELIKNFKLSKLEESKIASDNANIMTKIAEERTDNEKRLQERLEEDRIALIRNTISRIETAFSGNTTALTEEAAKQIEGYKNAYENGEINARQYADAVYNIEEKLNKDILAARIATLQKILQIEGLTVQERQRFQEELDRAQQQYSESDIQRSKKWADLTIEQRRQVRDKGIEFINELFAVQASIYEAQLQRAQESRDFEVALAGSNSEQRIKAERKYEKEERKIKQKQANAQKAQAIFNIITSTAENIAKFSWNPFLTALIIGIGAAQLATVVSTPVPQLAEGGEASGLVIVGDKKGDKTLTKGGGSELITLPTGESFLSPSTPTLMDLPIGTHVSSHKETQKILAQGAYNSATERIDMSKSERYLKKMANRDDVTYKDGYKFINKRGYKAKIRVR